MSNQDAWRLARDCVQTGTPVALVTVASVRGSAPREPGACLAVTVDATAGSIGGGRLEWRATAAARERLVDNTPWQLETITLNADIGQCCGGRVQLLHETLHGADAEWLAKVDTSRTPGSLRSETHSTGRATHWLEHNPPIELNTQTDGVRFTRPTLSGGAPVWLFGAGHVGLALARALQPLPLTLHQFDTREIPEHPSVETVAHPEALLRDAPQNSLVLIMTHDHALDYTIAEAALTAPQVRWVGLVGSASKRQQLKRRLERKLGTDGAAAALTRLSCPIGRHLTSRSPAEMATVIAAELLYARDSSH